MSVEWLSQFLSWAAVTLTVLAAVTSVAALHYRNVVATKKDAQIEHLKPRSVSASQKAELAKRLVGQKGNVAFIYRLMDGEGKDFSAQVASVFAEAGWTVVSIAGNSLNDFPGYMVVAFSEEKTKDAAYALCDVLNAAGLNCRQEHINPNTLGGPLASDTIYLIVGRKL